jgi:hypothetical protein
MPEAGGWLAAKRRKRVRPADEDGSVRLSAPRELRRPSDACAFLRPTGLRQTDGVCLLLLASERQASLGAFAS